MIKVERWAWDDAERRLHAAKGVIELLAEAQVACNPNADACDAVHLLITDAISSMESGWIRGSPSPEQPD